MAPEFPKWLRAGLYEFTHEQDRFRVAKEAERRADEHAEWAWRFFRSTYERFLDDEPIPDYGLGFMRDMEGRLRQEWVAFGPEFAEFGHDHYAAWVASVRAAEEQRQLRRLTALNKRSRSRAKQRSRRRKKREQHERQREQRTAESKERWRQWLAEHGGGD